MLASVKLDATERCRLADVRKEDVNQIIQTSTNLYINCVQVVKDKVYFSCGTVSYTHLDVYKRQYLNSCWMAAWKSKRYALAVWVSAETASR